MCSLTLLCWGVPYSLRSAFSPNTHPFQTAHILWAVHQVAVGSSSTGRGRTWGREAPPSPSCSTSLAEKNADNILTVYPVLFTGRGLYIQRCVGYLADNWLIKLIWTQEHPVPVDTSLNTGLQIYIYIFFFLLCKVFGYIKATLKVQHGTSIIKQVSRITTGWRCDYLCKTIKRM